MGGFEGWLLSAAAVINCRGVNKFTVLTAMSPHGRRELICIYLYAWKAEAYLHIFIFICICIYMYLYLSAWKAEAYLHTSMRPQGAKR